MTEPPIVRRGEPPIVKPPAVPIAPPVSTKRALMGYMDKRWAVLLLLFGCTAALGLPVLWKSRGFSKPEKIVWSVLVSLYTILVFWIFFKVMWWSYTNISESLR
jgi:hypothetical protein